MSAPLLLSTGLTSALSGGPGEHDHAPHDGPLAGEQFDETNSLLPSASAVTPPLPYQATLQNARLLMRMTPLPVMQLACLCALHLVEPMVMGQISPSVNAMLADLRPALPEVGEDMPASAGPLRGIFDSAFSTMQLFAVHQLVRLSGQYAPSAPPSRNSADI